MKLIFTIAWRNLMRHRGKSIVIGIILFMGSILMTVGNGFISGMQRGLEQNIVEGFTGHLVLVSDKQEGDNVILDMMGKTVEPISNISTIDSVLATQSYIDKWLPIGKNMAMAINEEGGMPDYVYITGVDFDRYQKFFKGNMTPIQGRLLKPGEVGVLIPTGWQKQFCQYTNLWFNCENCPLDTAAIPPEIKKNMSDLVVKNSVVYMGMNAENTTTDIRLGVKGIIKYRSLNNIWGSFPIVDIESYRTCMGYFSKANQSAPVSKTAMGLLSVDEKNIESFFSDAGGSESVNQEKISIVDTSRKDDINDGIYNLVLVKLKNGSKINQATASLNNLAKKDKLGLRAIPWNKAAGMLGSMAILVKVVLFTFVMFIFFVAIIIIINTLTMMAIERTTEIGMMRAVGAQKGFISSMFFAETALLSFVFGGIGIGVGVIVIRILSLLKLTSNNDFIQIIYGGDTLQPFLSFGDLAMVICQLIFVTLIAMAYPIIAARRITPLEAVSRD